MKALRRARRLRDTDGDGVKVIPIIACDSVPPRLAEVALCDERREAWDVIRKPYKNPIRRRTGLSRFQGITYGLRAKGCYTDTQRGPASYTETIYTLL